MSGHCTFSRSAASSLTGFFGTATVTFSTQSDGLPGATKTYNTFSAAADEAGISRIYGGIHFATANVAGQTMGHLIAQNTLAYYLLPLGDLKFAQISKPPADTGKVTPGKWPSLPRR